MMKKPVNGLLHDVNYSKLRQIFTRYADRIFPFVAEQVRRAVNEAVFVSAANVVGSSPAGWAIKNQKI